MTDDDDYENFIRRDPPPDLQALVRMAGERYAASLGVPFDVKNPAHGGYQHITAEEWTEHDRDMAAWQERRRARLIWTGRK